MHAPSPFLSEDLTLACNLINTIVMGTLITSVSSMQGSPLPFMVNKKKDGSFSLISHMDRANPLWHDLREGKEVLVVFWGPNTYLSPSVYTTKPRVPTWLYATVHAKGIPTLIQDKEGLDSIVSNLSRFMEKQDSTWDISQVKSYKEGLLSGIIGFEIELTFLQSQVRLAQKNTDVDKMAVYRSLCNGSSAERQVAELMDQLNMNISTHEKSNFE